MMVLVRLAGFIRFEYMGGLGLGVSMPMRYCALTSTRPAKHTLNPINPESYPETVNKTEPRCGCSLSLGLSWLEGLGPDYRISGLGVGV